MICTAPVIPACTSEATTELLTLTGAHLGFNCDKCVAWPAAKNPSTGKHDYATKPLEATSKD